MLDSRMTKEFLTTREAAAMLGVGTTSVKRWADTGVLKCVKTAGGHRRFPRTAVDAMLRTGIAEAGPEGEKVATWITLLTDTAPVDVLVERLEADYKELGSWSQVAEWMSPVLVELGSLWNTGEITVLQEHVASERLARALAQVAGSLAVDEDAPQALLLAAEGEEHTLGLSLVEICLADLGWRTRWVGRHTPFADVRRFVTHNNVGLLALSASSASTNEAVLAEQAVRYGALCRENRVELVVGGLGRWPDQLTYGHRVKTFNELHQVIRKPQTV